ncbi:diacylglycerol kinase [Sphingorhabdus sp. IMCC26285]|uniref:Diacylglycerol kinase n=1 Tax=Sphingorhabdus profundilacus TaxID=2509718 RepID=A0A6I4M0V3_9SPHN|nr:diacylglycerol kinase family protein [Sphingorhabdus profundilacus]MVZ97874.1 diacylglycerol kinase [Sphingorhabdus profundilacus]
MALVALLSNPNSTGNKSLLPAIRSYCARNPDIFHYEVEEIGQIAKALEMIARVKPKVLVVNGGDGTVQSALTELYHGGHFEGTPPPVAVLPNGKTNLIALDLGTEGDPLIALSRIVEVAKGDLTDHIVVRELIALSDGSEGARPVLGMFLGGAGLAETILYCRNKIYPLGLPNGLSHFLAAIAVFLSTIFRLKADFLPARANPISVSFIRQGELQGIFSVLIVTTLDKLLLGAQAGGARKGLMKFLAVDQRPWSMLKMIVASLGGKLGQRKMTGVHFQEGDTIRIDSDDSSVVLDGEVFEASRGSPIVLRSTPPVPFLKLAA